jgi:hypothetical protein
MPSKFVVIISLILIVIAVGALVWMRSVHGLHVATSDDEQAIRETILRARRIDIEAEYTFDSSQFATVYINDPRGGEITAEALAQIQEVRQDPTIRADQVGLLDYKQAVIEYLKSLYDNYMAGLRAKQAAGTLTEEEQIILNGETYGWPTPVPEDENAAAMATQACELFLVKATAYWETETAMPSTETVYQEYSTAYPMPPTSSPIPETATRPYPVPEAAPEVIHCPHPFPTPPPIRAPFRYSDPATLPPEVFEVDIYSIEIEGDVARVVVHITPVTSEYVLVKVDGQWYIAGGRLIKAEP